MRKANNISFGYTSSIPIASKREDSVAVSECTTNSVIPAASDLVFSQISRPVAMSRNFHDAIQFVEKQAEVISSMISNLESYLIDTQDAQNSESLHNIYLLYARAVEASLSATFRGKSLFDNLTDKPLRIHIEVDGQTRPVDLPNPQLSGIPALQGFVLGTNAGKFPSENIVCECISSLMGCLLAIHSEQEKISNLSKVYQSNCRKPLTGMASLPDGTSCLSFHKLHELRDSISAAWHSFLGSLGLKTA